MTIQVYFKDGRAYKTEAAPSIVSPDMLRGLLPFQVLSIVFVSPLIARSSLLQQIGKGGSR